MWSIHEYNYSRRATMAARACYTSDEVVGLLDSDDEDLDEVFFPGSDEEFGFEEEEVDGE